MFDAQSVKNSCVSWIRDFFKENGEGCNAIVGLSGGKDSSVVAALCVEALGKDRVIGVLMPNGQQHDIDMAELLVRHLGIRSYTVNIKDAFDGLVNSIPFQISEQSRVNLPPRILNCPVLWEPRRKACIPSGRTEWIQTGSLWLNCAGGNHD